MTRVYDPLEGISPRQEQSDRRRVAVYLPATGTLEVQDVLSELEFRDLADGAFLQVAAPRFFVIPRALAPTSVALTTGVGVPQLTLRLTVSGVPTNFMAGSAGVT